MRWDEDPELTRAQAEHAARISLWRASLTWGPLFLVCAAAFSFFLADELTGGNRGSWFLIVLLGFFSVLLGFQAIQPTWDLRAQPIEITGEVVRAWSRTDSFVVRSHYLRVEGKIFRVDRVKHGEFRAGDHVTVRYYPSSATVITIDLAEPPPPTNGGPGA